MLKSEFSSSRTRFRSSMSETTESPVTESSSAASGDSKNRTLGLALFATALAVIAIFATGWLVWQNVVGKQQEALILSVGLTEISGKMDLLAAEIADLQRDQQDLVNRDQLRIQLSNELEPIQEHQELLDESVAELRDAANSKRDYVLLEDAEQLLGMAARSVSINKDAKTAELALLQADVVLQQLSDARLASVRAQIGTDVQALRATALPDIEGMAASLAGLEENIESLPLLNEPDGQKITAEEPVIDDERSVGALVAGVWTDLKSMIQIQKVDQPVTPLLAPEQRYFLNLNLRLLLQRASVALWRGAGQQAERDLDTAIEWLGIYFDPQDIRVQEFTAELQRLRETNLRVSLPDVSGSYGALKEFRAQGE